MRVSYVSQKYPQSYLLTDNERSLSIDLLDCVVIDVMLREQNFVLVL